jgi:1-aminocyclopropane-1-carboxylate deaminase
MDIQLPTPVSLIGEHPGNAAGIRLLIKRDDLIHPVIQGNKWRKIHLLLERLSTEQVPGILTFGGAFSNYLHAVAYAGPVFGLQTVAIVRGTAADINNPTLSDATQQGMLLFPVPKKEYDLKEKSKIVQAIMAQFPDYTVVPEGGATREGIEGCTAIVHEIREQVHCSDNQLFIAIPAGTGCTAAGTIAGMAGKGHALVFPAASYGVSAETIDKMLKDSAYPPYRNFTFFTDYIGGKFASPGQEILDFSQVFFEKNAVRPDPVYTPRMLFGIYDLLAKGYFPNEATVVAIHTGGLQGWRGR